MTPDHVYEAHELLYQLDALKERASRLSAILQLSSVHISVSDGDRVQEGLDVSLSGIIPLGHALQEILSASARPLHNRLLELGVNAPDDWPKLFRQK